MTNTEIDFAELAVKIDRVEFDVPFRILPDGPERVSDVFAPEVYHSETDDIEIQGDGWRAITGFTSQHGYRGAVMHRSEFIGSGIARCLVEDFDPETIFVVVVVEVHDEESPAGWALLYRS